VNSLFVRVALAGFACAGLMFADDGKDNKDNDGGDGQTTADARPDGLFGIKDAPSKGAHGGGGNNNSGTGINYHGGPVFTSTIHVYYIFYGGQWTASDETILKNLINGLGGSPYFNINTTYYSGANKTPVLNSITLAGTYADTGSQGTKLSDQGVANVVAAAIGGGHLPADNNGVYYVLTSAEIKETSGFCSSYCGWHTYGTLSVNGTGYNIKYAFVGNPAQCPSACSAVTASTAPNGSLGADAMASIISHELDESATDPNLNAWYDGRGNENADKCAWTFGTEKTTQGGQKYNVSLNTGNFLIQQNWVNAGSGGCALSH